MPAKFQKESRSNRPQLILIAVQLLVGPMVANSSVKECSAFAEQKSTRIETLIWPVLRNPAAEGGSTRQASWAHVSGCCIRRLQPASGREDLRRSAWIYLKASLHPVEAPHRQEFRTRILRPTTRETLRKSCCFARALCSPFRESRSIVLNCPSLDDSGGLLERALCLYLRDPLTLAVERIGGANRGAAVHALAAT